MNGPVDSHIHIADPEFKNGYEGTESFSRFFSCTARPSEWPVQRFLSEKDERIFPFYGTHPWYADEHDNKLLENLLNECPKAGVGEIGLDGLKGDIELQTEIFQQQLALAEEYRRPVTIHMVKSEKETLDILRIYNIPRTIIHSFDSESYVKPFSEKNCYFSVSPRLLNKGDEKFANIIMSIPIERLLVESDYPGCQGSIHELMQRISSVLSIEMEELILITGRNAHEVIS